MSDFKKIITKELKEILLWMNERRNEWVLELFNEVVDQLKQLNNHKVEGWQPFRASFYCSIYGTETWQSIQQPSSL
jgi:hypothetical protein